MKRLIFTQKVKTQNLETVKSLKGSIVKTMCTEIGLEAVKQELFKVTESRVSMTDPIEKDESLILVEALIMTEAEFNELRVVMKEIKYLLPTHKQDLYHRVVSLISGKQ